MGYFNTPDLTRGIHEMLALSISPPLFEICLSSSKCCLSWFVHFCYAILVLFGILTLRYVYVTRLWLVVGLVGWLGG